MRTWSPRSGSVPTRYRALLLLATFAYLRFGELAGLRAACQAVREGPARAEPLSR
jgi:hypothetical protein